MAACEEDLHGVGGSNTDGATTAPINTDGFSSGLAGSVQSLCDEDEVPVPQPRIKVVGSVNFANSAMLIGVIYTVTGGGSSGGGSGDSFAQINQLDGCHNITGDAREALATAAFVLARSRAVGIRARAKFAEKYSAGSIFSLPLPDGSIARYVVGVYNATAPLVTEAPNSCN